MLRIALDVEGVLSNTHKAAVERSDRLKPEHNEQWGYPGDLYEEFMHVSQNLWHNHHEQIPPMEDPDTLHQATKELAAEHKVDIVTHRRNVDEQVQTWLADHGVVYDEFRAPSVEKDELDYDVYIDDKPALAERIINDPERVIVLRDRPYNEHIDDSQERIERAYSLTKPLFMFTDPYTVAHVKNLTNGHGNESGKVKV